MYIAHVDTKRKLDRISETTVIVHTFIENNVFYNLHKISICSNNIGRRLTMKQNTII